MIKGKNIYLRAIEPEDLELMYYWENNEKLWELGSTIVPFSRFTIRQYIEAEQNKELWESKQLRLMITLQQNDVCIGMIDLYNYEPLHSKAAVAILIDEKERKKGYAKEALELLIKYATNTLQLHQLYAFVNINNKDSIQLFLKTGFIQSAVLKDWLSFQKVYQNVAVMQYIDNIEK